MKPSREDVVHREQSRKPSKTIEGARPSGENGILIVVIIGLLCVVGAGAAGGWYLWTQMEAMSSTLENSTLALNDSESKLGSLKSELANTQRSSSKTEDEVSAEIKVIRSEIRKLWDVSNKRNKKAIHANKDKIESLSAGAKKQKSQLAKQSKSTSATALSVAQLQDELNANVQSQSALQAKIDALTDEVASLQVENDMLKSMAVEQEKLLQTFKTGAFQRQMTDLEQAVNAIDAHRRQVNGRLDQLDKEIGALYNKP